MTEVALLNATPLPPLEKMDYVVEPGGGVTREPATLAVRLAAVVRSGMAGRPVAFDTETDGTAAHEGARLRLVSVSDGTNTVVLDVERHRQTMTALLSKPFNWFAHNAEFDKAVVRANLGVEMTAGDTYVMAHLIEPRRRYEGGTGLRLGDLAEAYLDLPKLGDELTAELKRGGWTWATIPADNPVYLAYSARDAELTAQLVPALECYGPDPRLVEYECAVAAACARMEARGILLDQDYTRDVVVRLRLDAAAWQAKAAEMGVANVNSPRQVCAALGTANAEKETLLPLAKAGNDLAAAVLASKRAAKWASSYAGAFLRLAGSDGRVHAMIRPLEARTARMSISRPPLQQLPASAEIIRRCLIADPGQEMFAADFDAIEIRVLAALSGDPVLRDVLLSGEGFHDRTAATVFGVDYTPAQRKLAKVANFAVLYGGGTRAVAVQTGVDWATAGELRAGIFKTFPKAGRWSRALAKSADERGFVITRTGRRLPVDRDRGYSAANYVIQSTARDVFASALLRVEDAGLGEHLLCPIHDELLGQAPADRVDDVAAAVGAAMATELDGIPMPTAWKTGGRSWGHLGYGAAD